MKSTRLQCATTLLLLSITCAFAGKVEGYADKIAPLIDANKRSTLGVSGANSRVQKYVYWLATAKADKAQPSRLVIPEADGEACGQWCHLLRKLGDSKRS